ncbi:sigma 54-interacting transcriptional regulator [bacterium]|nr:sigma 54-interacting transcriptional regulator [bacterium]
MNDTKIVEENFKSLRNACHSNPVEYLKKAQNYRKKYAGLNKIHFLFVDAYAYSKIGRFDLAEPILTEILSLALQDKNFFFLVHGNLLLSLCYRKDLQKAKIFLETAEEYAREAQDTLLLAASLAYLGDYYFMQNNFDLSENFHLQVQSLLVKDEDSHIKLQSLLSLANTSIVAKKYKNALIYLFKGMEISERENNQHYSLTIKTNLAKVLMDLKRYAEGEKFLLDARELSHNLGLGIQEIQVLFSLAVLNLKNKSPQKALTNLDNCHALSLEKKFDPPEFYMDLYNNYAIAHALNGDFDQAITFLDKATACAIDIGDKIAEQEIYLNLAKMLMNVRQFDKAEALLFRSLKSSKKYKLHEHILVAKEILAKLYLSKKDYAKSFNLMQKIHSELRKEITQLKDEYNRIEVQNFDLNSNNKPQEQANSTLNKAFVGISEATRKVLHDAMLVAKQANVNVLIRGESGTGKEVVANLIHKNSLRKDYPFVPINAAAISSSLMESELFGHKKGSYTGAISNEKGIFLKAHKGTLFIDEITEIPIEFQAKLLRVLESKKVIPVGSSNEISFDTRIISSTNRSINDMVANDLFRLDLFYRINTIEIILPPLRDRKEDIPILVEHFVKMFCNDCRWNEPNIDSTFIQHLQEYSFPGNIRELKNIIEKLFILGKSSTWDAKLLDKICNLEIKSNKSEKHEESSEKDRITQALIRFKGIRRDAARFLDMSNSTMTRRIGKYNLEAFTRIHQAKKVTKK